MKPRLDRIRTTYDDSGNYDKEEYFRCQKQIYAKQIDNAIKVDSLTKKQFGLKPFEIGFMQSTAVKDEPKFKQIKKILMDYNKYIAQVGQIVESCHLKRNVLDLMLKFMRLMMMAPDINAKRKILDLAHYWMMQQLDPKSKRKTKEQMQKQIRNILVETQILPIDVVNKQLEYTRVQEDLKYYKTKGRTAYQELDAPKIQLQQYHTHKLEFISKQQVKLGNKPQRKWIDTVKFPKVQLPGCYIEEQHEKQIHGFQLNNQLNLNNQHISIVDHNKLDGHHRQNLPTNPTEPNQNIPTQQQVLNNDIQNQQLDFGIPNQDDGQVEEIEQPEDKKKGKLDPLVKIFLLERIRAKQKGQYSSEKQDLKQKNKANRTTLEEKQYLTYGNQWAKQRSRLKTQIGRKIQASKRNNKIVNQYSQKQYNNFLQNNMDSIKVKKTINEQYKHLSKVQMPPERLNQEQGCSLFDRRRVKTEYSKHPLSAILKDNERKQQRHTMMQEIGQIKEKFARARIYTPMDCLVKGLVNPAEKDEQIQEGKKILWPNCHLLSNPFMKISKKKKKKKKK